MTPELALAALAVIATLAVVGMVGFEIARAFHRIASALFLIAEALVVRR